MNPAITPLPRLIQVALLVCLLGALMAGLLTRAKLDDGLARLIEARVLGSAQPLVRSIERARGLGLELMGLPALPALLERHLEADPLIRSIDVLDPAGRVIASSAPARIGGELHPQALRVASMGASPWALRDGDQPMVGLSLSTGFGQVTGHVAIYYSASERMQALEASAQPLYRAAALVFGLAALLSVIALQWLHRRARQALQAPPAWRFMLACLLPLSLAMVVFAAHAQHAFERQLLPQAERKAEVLGAGLAGLIGLAIHHGFEFAQLRGVEASLHELRLANPEIAFVAVLDASGQTLFSEGTLTAADVLRESARAQVVVPLNAAGQDLGHLILGIDPAFVRQLLRDMAFDIGVVLVAALILAAELLRHAGGTLSAASAQPLLRVRAPLFAFILAEELTRPGLPAYIAQLAGEDAGLSASLTVGLPIALFMLIVALGQPGLGRWSERVGRGPAIASGALIAAAGFGGAALAGGFAGLLAARALSAVGYALVFAAAQGHVLDHAAGNGRSRGFAVFVGAIMAATVCGPAIGGMLSHHLGQAATFLASALLCLIAMWAARGLPRGSRNDAPQSRARIDLRALLRRRRFAALTLLAAVPAKILLVGGLFYLVPLYTLDMGYGPAVAGRLIMLYGLLMVVLVPLAAIHGERVALRASLLCIGLAVSAAGGLLLAALPQIAGLAALVALLGIGQALSISAQAALVGELCGDEIAACGEDAVYGAYRLIERLGNVAGPLLAAVLLAGLGFVGAFMVLGLLGLACALGLHYVVAPRPGPQGGLGNVPV